MKTEKLVRKLCVLFLTTLFCLLCCIPVFAEAEETPAVKWDVTLNGSEKGKAVKVGEEWYLESDTFLFSKKVASQRVVHLKISSKSGLQTGYYYFSKQGKIDQRQKFHDLDVKVNGVRLKGRYYFGKPNGRLYEQKSCSWVSINGSKYALNKLGKMYQNRWLQGRYAMSNGKMATNRKVSEGVYVGANGKKCTKNQMNLNSLKKQLQSTISGYGGTWSVYVKDLKTEDVISINDTSMYPASVVKLFVMEATYAAAAEKRITLTSSVKSYLKSMITVSDNESYNALIKIIGKGSFYSGCQYINRYMKKQGYLASGVHHSLHPASSSYQNDGNGSNRCSAKDVGTLLEKIYRNRSVSSAYSKQMLNYMLQQQRRWKIPAGLPLV